MNETPKYEVFISYRRDGGVDYARMIYLELKGRGYNTFFDFNSLRSGKFNEGIFKAIDECRYFILVLSENALARCMNEDDWVRHEIEYALSKGKEIVPVCPSGNTRGFPAEMPASFEPLRNIQVSRLDMDDLFDKSFDKIVEDRFDEAFRKGRSPVGVVPGVSNKSFTKIGLCIVGAILAAAAAVTVSIVKLGASNDERANDNSGPIAVKNGTKEANALDDWMSRESEGRRLMALLKENGWSTADADYVKASALLEESGEKLHDRKFEASLDKASEALRVLSLLADKLAEKKLLSIDAEVAELELSGDRLLRKKLELVNKIVPISMHNKKVTAAKQSLEDVLYPRMKVSVACEGKEVPAEFTLDVPVLRLDGPCTFCKDKGKKTIDKDCIFCRNRPQGRKWLEVYHDPGYEYHGEEILVPAGSKIKAPKEVRASKGDVVGAISVLYVKEDGTSYSARTEKLVANWIGETNVVVELKAQEKFAAGEVRIIPLPRCMQLEFVWCPSGEFEFEYREPGSAQVKQGRVSVKKGFWISKHEITGAQVRAISSFFSDASGDAPFRFSDSYACQFAKLVQSIIGGEAMVRIPTAEEWEVAAHYGSLNVNAENVNEYGWIDEPGKEKKIVGGKMWEWTFHDRGGKKPTGLGLYDMYGNAEEWTVGSIDASLGLKDCSWKCERCGQRMTVRGGSVRVSASNAVQILTRDYMKGRPADACSMYRKETQYDRPSDGLYLNCAIRLVADELPSPEDVVKNFGGRHWLCEHCGEFAIDMNEPGKKGCKAGMHSWKAGELKEGQLFGPVPQVCENCGIKRPDGRENNDCKCGVHKWNWLADVGNEKYRCKYCQKELMVRKYPMDVYSRICPGPAGQPKQKDIMGREETYMHKWEKVKE